MFYHTSDEAFKFIKNMKEYEEFLKSKQHSSQDFGIKVNYLPDKMFDFQKYVSEYIIKKGRGACFLKTF